MTVEQRDVFMRRICELCSADDVLVRRTNDIDRVLDQLESERLDLVLVCDSAVELAETSGLELLSAVASTSPGTQVLFVVSASDVRRSAALFKATSFNYTKRPVSDDELRLLVEAALANRARRRSERSPAERAGGGRLNGIIGRAEKMQDVYRQIRQAASTDIPVLILGETGTGKDLVAQAVHEESERHGGPYIPVNLGALPSELVASELFGHEKGAFTGAQSRRVGRFEEACDGTIFLDEIGSISERVQVSLLRLIEQKRFHRLGGRKRITTSARIVAASNDDLAGAVQQGRFRQDLYYRLDIFRIVMPPLRSRQGDIPLLIDEFVKRFNRKFDKKIMGISPECMVLLEGYGWPGNVRELKNVIQRAVLVCPGDIILPEHLPPRFCSTRPVRTRVAFDVGTPLDAVEREMIVRTLAVTGNNRKRAAELLGISRRALYNKLKKHDIE